MLTRLRLITPCGRCRPGPGMIAFTLPPSRAYNGDTIYSVSSGPVTKAGVCVLRTSGPASKFCIDMFLGEPKNSNLEPRKAHLKKLFCPNTGFILDKALVLWFPGPHSFTGEDTVEMHVHGSAAVVSGVLEGFEFLNRWVACQGSGVPAGRIRPAEAGEYTRRAFQNGKMDLTEVEGLADLLEAQTGVQRVQALNQMEGHLRAQFEHWRAEIVHCLAHMEAVIDFGDDDREDDVSEAACVPLFPRLGRLLSDLKEHLDDGRRGEIIREGFRIVLAGPPNAGKSSVLNLMARRPAAIVSPEPGTTRDAIEVRLSLGGVCCLLTDTAGIREHSESAVEREGIHRARTALSGADLRIFVCDSSDESSLSAMTDMATQSGGRADNTLLLFNKTDLLSADAHLPEVQLPFESHSLSCASGEGVKAFELALQDRVRAALTPRGGGADAEGGLLGERLSGITRQRHRFHIEQCVGHLTRFMEGDGDSMLLDVRAEELRLASQELARVTGHVDIEELLDIIFRDFCIGK